MKITNKKYTRFLIALLFLLASMMLICPDAAKAQANKGVKANKGPISISADSMEADEAAKVVVFSGQVVARQDGLTITCGRMTVNYTDKESAYQQTPQSASAAQEAAEAEGKQKSSTPGGGQAIDRIECRGAVKIVEGDRMAVGDTALYLARSTPRRIILTGQARIWQGEDSLSGHEIIYYLDGGRSQVKGQGSQRVKATFQSGGTAK